MQHPARELIPEMFGSFADRKGKVLWPTLRGGRLTDENVAKLKSLAGIVFLDGMYQTNLNYGKSPPEERAIFFETRERVYLEHDGKTHVLYALVWVGNYYKGSVFHLGWQFPHMTMYDAADLEGLAFKIYKLVAWRIYGSEEAMDREVREFLLKGDLFNQS